MPTAEQVYAGHPAKITTLIHEIFHAFCLRSLKARLPVRLPLSPTVCLLGKCSPAYLACMDYVFVCIHVCV